MDNALSQWRFDIPLDLGYDATGSFNDLVMPAVAPTVPYIRVDNPFNAAYSFQNAGYLTSTNPFNFSSEFSLELLLEFPTVVLGGSVPVFLTRASYPSIQSFAIMISAIGEVQVYSNGILLGSSVRDTITTAQTYHLVVSKYFDDVLFVFVNARIVLQISVPTLDTFLSPYLQYVNLGQNMIASLDEVSVYNYALTSTQVNFHLSTLDWCLSGTCTTGCYANSLTIERCNLQTAQRIALEEFYYAMKGTNWLSPQWDLQVDLCKSFNFDKANSVFCDNKGNVLTLSLSSRNLVGSIPSSMGNLIRLQTLNLQNNTNVNPQIPQSLKNLQSQGLHILI